LSKVFTQQREKEPEEKLLEAMKSVCEKLKLQPTEKFLTCIVKMYELIKVKQGVIILGQPFAGKTKAYKILAAALNEIVKMSSFKTFKTVTSKTFYRIRKKCKLW
jgi:uracil DNA glycosylase